MKTDEPAIVPYTAIIRDRHTTWGELLGLPPPWPAVCDRCGTNLGQYDDHDQLHDAITTHLAWCTRWRWRLAWRRIRRWLHV